MKLDRALALSSILLAATSFIGLTLTREVPLGLIVLGALAFGVSLARTIGCQSEWVRHRLSPEAWNLLMVIAFVAFIIDTLWISHDLLPASIHFLSVLMVHKLLTLERRKDILHLFGISLVALLAVAALTGDLWYGAVLTIYLLAAIWTLLLYHLKVESEESQTERSSAAPDFLTAQFFWITNSIAVAALGLTLVIFFLIPRISAGFFQKNRTAVVRTSGFSEQVDLGTIGAIKMDPTVVMRVEFPDGRIPPGDRLYLRGAAYNIYNGRSWENSFSRRRVLSHTFDGEFDIPGAVSAKGRSSGVRQEILLEPLDTPVLFGVPFLQSVKGSFQLVQVDGMGNWSLPYPPTARVRYSARSIPDRLIEKERSHGIWSYPEVITKHFLQLPDTSPRIAELAKQVARQAKTPYEAARAIERHLRGNYRYSLDVDPVTSRHPVEDFLFLRKTGYCAHYATAMVIMLRTLGVPSRLATGFLPGEWNEFGSYYTVRQRDAHAWVEVFLPESGWVTFDPTPSAAGPSPNPLWSRVGSLLDSIRMKWDRFVIQYSFQDQWAVAQELHEQGGQLRSRVSSFWGSALQTVATVKTWLADRLHASKGLVGGLLLVLAALGSLIAAGQLIARRVKHLANSRHAAPVKLYQRMLRLLASHGLEKPANMTPLEFARRVARERAEASPIVSQLTELYCRARFGQVPWTPEDLQRAKALLDSLKAVSHVSSYKPARSSSE